MRAGGPPRYPSCTGRFPVAEFGLELAAPHWGRGYATEAGEALVAYGFTTLHLTAVLSS